MCGSSAPPPPDYSGVAEASEKSAEYAFKLGQEQLAWAKQQYASDKAIIDKVINAGLERQAINDTNAAKDRARYESSYQPLEDDAIAEAKSYASPERQQYEMGRAGATVAQQFDAQRQAAAQNLEAFGVDPTSTRFAAIDAGTRVQQAAAQAGAENQARAQTEAVGRAMRSEAINVGRGYPGQIAGTYGTALQSGASAANSALAGTASGAATMGTNTQYQGLGNQAINTWGNTLNQGYQNQLGAFQANQNSSSGLGSLLGAGAGLIASFEDGGPVGAGSVVPPHVSPSGGARTDDVRAAIDTGGEARINVGEFIVPKEVVEWYGERHFQQMIDKAHKDKGQASAKPSMKAIPAGQPARQSALPLR